MMACGVLLSPINVDIWFACAAYIPEKCWKQHEREHLVHGAALLDFTIHAATQTHIDHQLHFGGAYILLCAARDIARTPVRPHHTRRAWFIGLLWSGLSKNKSQAHQAFRDGADQRFNPKIGVFLSCHLADSAGDARWWVFAYKCR